MIPINSSGITSDFGLLYIDALKSLTSIKVSTIVEMIAKVSSILASMVLGFIEVNFCLSTLIWIWYAISKTIQANRAYSTMSP